MLSIVVIAYLEIKAVVTDNIFHIVMYIKVQRIIKREKMLGRDFILSIDCSLDFDIWTLHSKVKVERDSSPENQKD